jgi:hypothetical protein
MGSSCWPPIAGVTLRAIARHRGDDSPAGNPTNALVLRVRNIDVAKANRQLSLWENSVVR